MLTDDKIRVAELEQQLAELLADNARLRTELEVGGPDDPRLRIERLVDEVHRLRTEVARLEAWVNDLQAGMFINCVYCGHRYGPDDKIPATMADALKEHVENCPKHPMSALKIELARLEAERDALRKCYDDYRQSEVAELVALRAERDDILALFRAPDSTNDGGAADVVEEVKTALYNHRVVQEGLEGRIGVLNEQLAALRGE